MIELTRGANERSSTTKGGRVGSAAGKGKGGGGKKPSKGETAATIHYESTSSFAQKLTIDELSKFILKSCVTDMVEMSFHPTLPCRVQYRDRARDIWVRYYLGHQQKSDDEL